MKRLRITRSTFLVPLLLLAAVLMLELIPGLQTELGAKARPTKKATIRWKRVPRATAYLVEIKNAGGRIVLKKETKRPILKFVLPQGRYKVRLSSLNKFYKPAGKTPWFAIKIRKAFIPRYNSISVKQLRHGQGKTRITVYGDNFLKGCRVYLRSAGDTGEQVHEYSDVSVESLKRIVFTLSPDEFVGGSYNITLTNPGNRSGEGKNVLEIVPAPIYSSVSPSIIDTRSKEKGISISGDRFSKGCTFTIEKDGKKITPKNITRVSKNEITGSISPAELGKGSCSITITNPYNLSVTAKNVITIKTKKVPTLFIGIAPMYSLLFSDWSNTLDNDFTGGKLYFGYSLKRFAIIKAIPVLGSMGLETEFDLVYYPSKSSTSVTSTLLTYSLGLGIFYRENWGLPVDFILRGGGGLTMSSLNTTISNVQVSATSTDPFFYFGAAVSYEVFDPFFVEAGANFKNITYYGSNLMTLQIFLKLGVQF
ncbi:MAG: porin family protein [bacterium]|nr:porin family protein [bacterium]